MLDSDISTTDALALLHRAESDPFAVRSAAVPATGRDGGRGRAGERARRRRCSTTSCSGTTRRRGPPDRSAPPMACCVVIGMFGGNDGLNTLVPFNDGLYYDQHGGLAIPGNQTLPICRRARSQPGAHRVQAFWDAGQLAVVQGVGYPNADFSHFNSMAYWMAGQVGGIPSTGWVGRWLDGYLGGGRDLYAAAEVGHSVPLHLDRRRPTRHRGARLAARASAPGPTPTICARIRRSVPCRRRPTGRGTPPSARRSSTNSTWRRPCRRHYPDDEDLPESEIVARLEIAARMINANLGFRVLTAGCGDFDSHANQPDDAHRADAGAERRRQALLRDPQSGVALAGDDHDVLRVRADELGQRRSGHRSRVVRRRTS